MLDAQFFHRWMSTTAASVDREAAHLTDLDSAIGDADHGVNLRRGFTAVTAALDGFEAATVGDVLVKTGSTLVSKVGGAAGPLYGTAFRAIGKALPEAEVDAGGLAKALRAGLEGLQKLGAAVPGDKTIIDAYAPAVAAFEASVATGGTLGAAAAAAAEAAEAGMRETTALQARKGRASYLGPRSVGHQDPGATSVALLLQAAADTVA